MPSEWAYPSCCFAPCDARLRHAGVGRGTPRSRPSRRLIEDGRPRGWTGTQPHREEARWKTPARGGRCLYSRAMGRSQSRFRRPSRRHPDNIFYKGRLGASAAAPGRPKPKRKGLPQSCGAWRRRTCSEITPPQCRHHQPLLGRQRGRSRPAARGGCPRSGKWGVTCRDMYGYGFVFGTPWISSRSSGFPPFEDLIKLKE